MSGFAVGYSSVTVPLYIAEMAPASLRGTLGVANQLCITSGIFVLNVAALPTVDHHDYWRALMLMSLAFAGLLLLGLLAFGVESPRWLLAHGRATDARHSLELLRGTRAVDDELAELENTAANDASGGGGGGVSLSALLEGASGRALGLGVMLMVLQQWSGINAFVFNSKQLFEGENPQKDAEGRVSPDKARTALIGAILVALVQVVFTFVSAAAIERRGRRFFLSLSSFGMAATCLVMGFLYREGAPQGAKIVAVMCYMAFFSLGLGPLPYVVCSEIFPNKTRSTLISISILTNWLCAFAVTYSFDRMNDALSSAGTFWFYGCVCVAGGLAVLRLVPETKGKTLEEIQALFAGSGADATPLLSG